MLCLLETMWKKHLMRILPELLVVAPKLQGSGNPALTRDSLHMVFAAESEILRGFSSRSSCGTSGRIRGRGWPVRLPQGRGRGG